MNSVVEKYIGGYDNIEKRRQTINIYRGGKKYTRVVGEECEFKIRDILISLKYLDLSIIDKKNAKKEKILKSIHETFLLTGKILTEKIFNEIDFLSSMPDYLFAQIYAKKFKLYLPFSDALYPLFAIIKEYFEKLIKLLGNDLQIDMDKYIEKWTSIDNERNIKSSSIILYQLGKDQKFMEEMINNANKTISGRNEKNNELVYLMVKFKEYIHDIKKWSYIGWCPNSPDVRMKHLMKFPLDIIFNILSINRKEYIDAQREFIFDIDIKKILSYLPSSPSDIDIDSFQFDRFKIKKIKITPKIATKKIKKMIIKLNKTRSSLIKWEDYYILFAKTYSLLYNNFQSNNSNLKIE